MSIGAKIDPGGLGTESAIVSAPEGRRRRWGAAILAVIARAEGEEEQCGYDQDGDSQSRTHSTSVRRVDYRGTLMTKASKSGPVERSKASRPCDHGGGGAPYFAIIPP